MVLAQLIEAPQDKARRQKIDKVDFVNGAHGQARRYSDFWKIHIVAPQDQTRCHKIDIVDFFNWAHGQARRHSGFGKYLLELPKSRHATTKYILWIL